MQQLVSIGEIDVKQDRGCQTKQSQRRRAAGSICERREIKATGPLLIFRPRSSRRAVRDRLANRGIGSILAVIADVHRFGTFRGLTAHFGR